MKLDGPQSFDINTLKGALISNPDGGEFYVTGVSVDISNHEILIELRDADYDPPGGGSVEWSKLKDWSIQFQGGQ